MIRTRTCKQKLGQKSEKVVLKIDHFLNKLHLTFRSLMYDKMSQYVRFLPFHTAYFKRFHFPFLLPLIQVN